MAVSAGSDAEQGAWLDPQYLRDLETLDRIEFQNECFFDAMGTLHAERMEDPT